MHKTCAQRQRLFSLSSCCYLRTVRLHVASDTAHAFRVLLSSHVQYIYNKKNNKRNRIDRGFFCRELLQISIYYRKRISRLRRWHRILWEQLTHSISAKELQPFCDRMRYSISASPLCSIEWKHPLLFSVLWQSDFQPHISDLYFAIKLY